jgi:hypothetical protein
MPRYPPHEHAYIKNNYSRTQTLNVVKVLGQARDFASSKNNGPLSSKEGGTKGERFVDKSYE